MQELPLVQLTPTEAARLPRGDTLRTPVYITQVQTRGPQPLTAHSKETYIAHACLTIPSSMHAARMYLCMCLLTADSSPGRITVVLSVLQIL